MNTVQEKPPPVHLISPLPIVQTSPIWSPNSGQLSDGTRYRKSVRKSQKRQSSLNSFAANADLQTPPEFQDGAGSTSLDPSQTILRLERNIKFLKDQHVTILSSLHKEIDELKRKNKNLQFQLVMGDEIPGKHRKNSSSNEGISVKPEDGRIEKNELALPRHSSASAAEKGSDSAKKISDLQRHISHLEEENRDLVTALSDANDKNLFMSSRFEQMKRQSSGMRSRTKGQPAHHNDIPVMYSQRLEDLDEMLQQQKRENVELQIELSRLKTMIREILSSSKWSSEAYGIARSILQEGHGHDRKGPRLPRIPLRPHEPQRLASLPTISQPAYMAAPLGRGQASLPSIPPSKQKNFSNSNGQMQFNGNNQPRYKSPNTQKKKQQRVP